MHCVSFPEYVEHCSIRPVFFKVIAIKSRISDYAAVIHVVLNNTLRLFLFCCSLLSREQVSSQVWLADLDIHLHAVFTHTSTSAHIHPQRNHLTSFRAPTETICHPYGSQVSSLLNAVH